MKRLLLAILRREPWGHIKDLWAEYTGRAVLCGKPPHQYLLVVKTHVEAIRLVRNELKRREERLIELRVKMGRDEYAPGFDREQFTYCMGRADECREILSVLGEFDWNTNATKKMKEVMGWK